MSNEVETSRCITSTLAQRDFSTSLRFARNDKCSENCRFFFPNATYMVGDVFPDIHFKNFRATANRSLARRHTDCDWPRSGHTDGRQNQTVNPSGSSDRARCDWRIGSGALACKTYAWPDYSAGIRMGESRPFAFYSWRFRLWRRYGYLLINCRGSRVGCDP